MTAQHLSDDLANNIGPVTCERCDLAQICELLGRKPPAGGERHCAVLRFVPAGHTLYRAGESAKHFYAVRKGISEQSERRRRTGNFIEHRSACIGSCTILHADCAHMG